MSDSERVETGSIEGTDKTKNKPGMVYISRIPPGMTPSKVRAIMAQHGELGRIYLAPAANSHPKNPRFKEGWIEFKKRKVAKIVAQLLNAQPIGGKKGDRYRDDIWTMKFLGGFKWEMLSEHIAIEQASHASKLRNELSQSKREQEDYLKRVDRAKKQTAIEERRQAKNLPPKSEKQYEFKQRQVVTQDTQPQESNAKVNAKRKRAGYDTAAEQQKAKKLESVLGNLF